MLFPQITSASNLCGFFDKMRCKTTWYPQLRAQQLKNYLHFLSNTRNILKPWWILSLCWPSNLQFFLHDLYYQVKFTTVFLNNVDTYLASLTPKFVSSIWISSNMKNVLKRLYYSHINKILKERDCITFYWIKLFSTIHEQTQLVNHAHAFFQPDF